MAVAATALGMGLDMFDLLQTRNLHSDALGKAKQLHKEALKQAEDMHRESMTQSERAVVLDVLQERMVNRREAARDRISQSGNLVNTLLVTVSLGFAGGFALLIEGTLPQNAGKTYPMLARIYIFSLGVGIMLQVLSIMVAMKVQNRIAQFRLTRSSNFDLYYQQHCKRLYKLASIGFRIGIFFLLCGASILVWARCTHELGIADAGYVFAGIMGTAIILVLAIEWKLRSRYWFKCGGVNSDFLPDINDEGTRKNLIQEVVKYLDGRSAIEMNIPKLVPGMAEGDYSNV